MLMIGSTGRNVGKTTFACEVIRRHAKKHQVIGIKITTIQTRDGSCPHGGQGCGVCGTLKTGFSITREQLSGNEKDTTRLLLAGAEKVFWLRVMRGHMEEGLRSLLAEIPGNAMVVCESNSARTVIEPGVFLMIQETGSTDIKPSCDAVLKYADRRVMSLGNGWDFQPDRLAVAGNRWVIRPNATAIILAGGESRRMGQDKSLLPINGRPLISHIADQLHYFPERLVSSNDPEKFAFLQLPVIPDREPGQGPLMGILSCVSRATHDLCFVTGCDIPTLDPGFIMHLLALASDNDIVMPRHADGRMEPLLAAYRKSIIPAAEAGLHSGNGRITAIFGQLRVCFIAMDESGWYHNLNTMNDFHRLTGL